MFDLDGLWKYKECNDFVKLFLDFSSMDAKLVFSQPQKMLEREIERLQSALENLDNKELKRQEFEHLYNCYTLDVRRYLVRPRDSLRERIMFLLEETFGLGNERPKPPERDEVLFLYRTEEMDLMQVTQQYLAELSIPLYEENSVTELKETEQVINHLIAEFLNVKEKKTNIYSTREDHIRVNYINALRCKYIAEIKELQKLRQTQMLQFVSDLKNKSDQEFNRVFREYRRMKNPLSDVEDFHEDEWLKELYELENFYLDDVLFELEELKAIRNKTLRPLENVIQGIEQTLQTEVEAQSALERLLAEHPNQEEFLRRRFRKMIDAFRERNS